MESGNHEIVNRVALSNLITFNLEDYYTEGERVQIDISGQLYQGLILREKEFREFVKLHDWSQYGGKFVAVTCSADAIVPTWAYMLLTVALGSFAKRVVFGNMEDLEIALFREALEKVDWISYKDTKVVVKGCSKVEVPTTIYMEVTRLLYPFVASLMFGEPCSTVPLYKKPRK